MQERYAVYYPGCCAEHGGPELKYYESYEEAKKAAKPGDKIFKLIEEIMYDA